TLQQRIARVGSVLALVPEDFNPGSSGYKKHVSSPLSPPPEDTLDSLAEKQTIAQVIQAQEDERLRVSRQIHDGPAQTMTNLVLRAESCERLLDMDTNRARTELAGLKSAVHTTWQETRRFTFDWRPKILADLGLEA